MQSGEFTILLNECAAGNKSALDALTSIVYSELRRLASSPARGGIGRRSGAAGIAWRRMTVCWVSDEHCASLLAVHPALGRLALQDERKAKVIELKYFGGLNREEIAAALDLTVATAKRDLSLGEAWPWPALSSEGAAAISA